MDSWRYNSKGDSSKKKYENIDSKHDSFNKKSEEKNIQTDSFNKKLIVHLTLFMRNFWNLLYTLPDIQIMELC